MVARFVLGVIAIALPLMAPGQVRAQACATDADCAKGLSCQTDTAVSTPPSICIADSSGTRTCTPVAEPAPTKTCQLGPCASAADCGPDMVCHTSTTTECSGGAPVPVRCDPNAEACPPPPPPQPSTCTDTTTSRCTYPWALPCSTDIDCGEAFACKPRETNRCSGSSGAGSAGTGASTGSASAGTGGASGPVVAPSPADFDGGMAPSTTCTIVTSFPGSCKPKVTACASDADCPSIWICASENDEVAMPTSPADGGAGVGESPKGPTPVTTSPTKICQLPSTGGTRGGTPVTGGEDGTYQPPTTPALSLPDAGVGPAKNAADAGAATTASTPPVPTTNNQGPGASPPESAPVAARTSGGNGCSVAAGAAEGSVWLVGVMAVLGLLIARRRRM